MLHDQRPRVRGEHHQDVTDAKEAELRQRFLAQAGQLLASSLDYEETLQRVAVLAVPWLADWCAVDLPNEHGGIRQVALAHADPAKVAIAEELRRRYPPDPDAAGVPGVLRGRPGGALPRDPRRRCSRQAIEDPEQLAAIRALGMRAVMIVPMRLGETTLGAITLVTADSGRRSTDDDFAFAQDLALRAASAIQNARLYRSRSASRHAAGQPAARELPPCRAGRAAACYQAGEQGVGGRRRLLRHRPSPAAAISSSSAT